MNCDLKMDSPGVDRDTRDPTAPTREDSESLELTNQSEENRDKEESGAGEGGVSIKLEDGDVVVRGASSEDKEEVEESPEETVSLGGEGEAVNSQDSEEHVDEKEEGICTPEHESSVHQDLPSSQEHSASEGKVTPTADTAMSAASGGSETPEEGKVPSERVATPTSDSAVASVNGRGVTQDEEEVPCELKTTPTSDTDGVSVSGGGVAQVEGEVPPEDMATPTTDTAVASVRGKGGVMDEKEVPSEHMATPTTDTAVASVSGKGRAPEKGDTAGQQGARRVAEEEKHAGDRGEGPRKKKSAPITPKSSSSPSSVSLPRSRTAPRSSAGRTKKDILAKFQQSCPEGPVIPNFKVQRSRRAGVSDGSSVKQRLLQWCRKRTAGYPGVSIENYSSSWSDGLAFCALVHNFFPHAFDFSSLRAEDRERNFSLAFTTAEQEAGCDQLLDVSDMLLMGNRPDPLCVFTYLQSLYNQCTKAERERREKDSAREGETAGNTKEDKEEGRGESNTESGETTGQREGEGQEGGTDRETGGETEGQESSTGRRDRETETGDCDTGDRGRED